MEKESLFLSSDSQGQWDFLEPLCSISFTSFESNWIPANNCWIEKKSLQSKIFTWNSIWKYFHSSSIENIGPQGS